MLLAVVCMLWAACMPRRRRCVVRVMMATMIKGGRDGKRRRYRPGTREKEKSERFLCIIGRVIEWLEDERGVRRSRQQRQQAGVN